MWDKFTYKIFESRIPEKINLSSKEIVVLCKKIKLLFEKQAFLELLPFLILQKKW